MCYITISTISYLWNFMLKPTRTYKFSRMNFGMKMASGNQSTKLSTVKFSWPPWFSSWYCYYIAPTFRIMWWIGNQETSEMMKMLFLTVLLRSIGFCSKKWELSLSSSSVVWISSAVILTKAPRLLSLDSSTFSPIIN